MVGEGRKNEESTHIHNHFARMLSKDVVEGEDRNESLPKPLSGCSLQELLCKRTRKQQAPRQALIIEAVKCVSNVKDIT